MPPAPKERLEVFQARYAPEIASTARAIHAALRKKFPTAVNLIYDNYNALVIGFGPTERPSEAFLSIVLYPSYVTLCFLHGKQLEDPAGLLSGSGNQVRAIRRVTVETLAQPAVQRLLDQAAALAGLPPSGPRGKLIIRAVSAKQRPRRPA